jgi:hypothetical protein
MISEINERIRNKEQFIKNVNLYHYSDDGAVTAKHICINEVAFLKELQKYVDVLARELQSERELKTLISFERDINAGREDQLEQDIKHLRGVIDERGDLLVIAEQRKKIAELAETIAELKRDNKYFRKELGFWKGSVTGDEHDYEYDSLA